MISFSTSCSDISTRLVTPADRDFLCALYASTRLEELRMTGWEQEQIDVFLEQQFEAQSLHYAAHYNPDGFMLLCQGKEAIGRLYLEERTDEIRIVDIALLPAHRGQGIGRSVLTDVMTMATQQGKCVRIHVEQNNPAQSLYQRLGYTKIDEHGIYHLMEYNALTQTPAT